MNKGTIVRVVGGLFYVLSDSIKYKCTASGRLRDFKIIPIAGDHVYFEKTNDKEGYIKEVLERKNRLIRPPVANVDQVIVVVSLKQPEFSSMLLDKYLVQILDNEIEPIIYLSKKDLVDDLSQYEKIMKYYQDAGFKVYFVNSLDIRNKEIFEEILTSKISVLTGQSGGGKSTFINGLGIGFDIKTGEYSKALGRGRHTTREVEFLDVYGGLLADTPGFSSLDLDVDEIRLSQIYPCFKEYALDCKFRGCLHKKNSSGCKVREAVNQDLIAEETYGNYLKILEEIENRPKRW